MKFRSLHSTVPPRRVSPVTRHPSPTPERGVALVITLILLAVITFMAVTFLVISNSQQAAAGTAQQQTVARLAAGTAQERFVADLVARIIATSNAYNAGLFVSTNFYNVAGFTNGVLDVNNVNFDYYAETLNGPLSANDARNNLLNLLYDARVPVYVVTNRTTGAQEFRFYRDENRNGHFDTNGLLAERDFNGLLIPNGTNGYRSNYFVGDPQWIGILERPEFPHSPSNRFIARFCYYAVPIGNALDVNYIHNQAYNPAKPTMQVSGEDFFRNQGVGPWEINLAAFLTDLNSNVWPGIVPSYNYRPTNAPSVKPASGTTFEDAFQIYRYRLNGLAYNLSSVRQIYGSDGATGFEFDQRDGYTAALTPNLSPSGYSGDPDGGRVGLPWPGSENPNHIFSLQDWFNRTRLGRVADKLTWLTTSNSTYDNTTFTRLQEQLGTGSAPDTGKMNLNFVNLGALRETNFVSWHDPNVGAKISPALAGVPGPLIFFTNAANRILRAQFNFGVTDIPVWSNGIHLYTPSVHRSLQLAANLYEASTNSHFPLVFRPRLTKKANGLVTISGYDEVSTDPAQLTAPKDIVAVTEGTDMTDNVYGVPWIIGAKKGLPNLNEIGLATRSEVTRKLLVTKPANATSPGSGWTTNVQYSMNISNAVAVEAWNSYAANYPGPVQLLIHGDLTTIVTNENGVVLTQNGVPMNSSLGLLPPATNVVNWSGYLGGAGTKSLVVPLSVGQLYLPTAIYDHQARNFNTKLTTGFGSRTDFPQPKWGIFAKIRLRFAMVDVSASPPHIIDCVQIDESNRGFDLAEAIRDADKKEGLQGLWSTNLVSGGGVPQGVLNQMLVSLGAVPSSDWKNFGKWGEDGKGTKEVEIAKFLAFMFPRQGTNKVTQMQVPFSPTRIKLHKTSLQVNDPMVHYLASDLRDLTVVGTNAIEEIPLQFTGQYQVLKNIGVVNTRYAPWGVQGSSASGEVITGFPDLYDIALKDPGVTNSSAWNFPTNSTYPNIGWIGRVHRGTPWQTVYLKADDIPPASLKRKWQNWTGNENSVDAAIAKPANDRLLFDLFTATVDENVTRGLLPVNQTNLAAWSAVFGGVVVLSNSASATETYPYVVAPVSVDGPNGPMSRIYAGITRTRNDTNQFPHRAFTKLGDVLATPELTDQSPFITTARSDKSAEAQRFRGGMTDAVYEWLPQQVMGLLKLTEPRYVVYAYGQSLKPAPGAVVTSGPFFGLCTNYQVTAEIATRSVIRVVNPNSATPTIEQVEYNLLRPD